MQVICKTDNVWCGIYTSTKYSPLKYHTIQYHFLKQGTMNDLVLALLILYHSNFRILIKV